MKNIVFTGGGTAGHIMPNLAIIENLKDYKIYYLGSNGMEKDIVSNMKNIEYIEIPAVKFIRSFTPKNLLIPYKLSKAISITKKILKQINPVLIFSKGGFVSIPVALAGSRLNIPIITHESDLTVGLANKIIATKAKLLCCSFEETAKKHKKRAIHTGTPIRNKILQGNKYTILSRHSIKNNLPIVLIVGGSSGARAINNCIWENIDALTSNYQIIHITGKNNINKDLLNKNNYIQIEFAYDIENYFSASDIVISRAGSNTIFELLALQKLMILIPLPKSASRGDQILNAINFEENKFARNIMQENLTFTILKEELDKMLKNKNKYIEAMKKSNYCNGTDKIIKLIKECEL